MSTIKQISVLQSNGSYLSKDIGVDAQNVDIDSSHTLAGKAIDWDNKVDRVNGKGLSTNDFTDTDKNKLNNLNEDAEPNIIENIQVNGSPQTVKNKTVNIIIPEPTPVVEELEAEKVNIDETHTLADKVSDWDNKVDKIEGKELSSNDFTDDYKEKIDNLNENADANVIETIQVNGVTQSVRNKTVNIIIGEGSGGSVAPITFDELDADKVIIDDSHTLADKVSDWDNKVDKEKNKGLSTNDYTTAEKNKLNGIEEEAEVNIIESISINGTPQTVKNKNIDIIIPEPTPVIEKLNADKVNIDETHTLADKAIDWDNKVDKVNGKNLSTNDYTDEDKEKLNNLENYDDSILSNRVSNIENIIPSTATEENKLATLNDITPAGTTDYESLENKPQIAGIELNGNKTLSDLGIQSAEEGKGLSSNDYTNEDKEKLAELSNYDDTSLTGRVTNIEDVIPSTATEENKLATLADIPVGGGSESSNTFNTSDFDITEQGEVSLKPSQRTWVGTNEEWNALTEEEKAKYGGIINIIDDPEKGFDSLDFDISEQGKVSLKSNQRIWVGTQEEWDALTSEQKKRYDGGMVSIVNNNSNNIGNLSTITVADIDRIWGNSLNDGDNDEY